MSSPKLAAQISVVLGTLLGGLLGFKVMHHVEKAYKEKILAEAAAAGSLQQRTDEALEQTENDPSPSESSLNPASDKPIS